MPNKNHETDVAFIKALAELLNDNDLTELQVKRDYGENDSLNVRVSRQKEIVTQMQAAPAPAAQMAAPAPAAAAPAPAAQMAAPAPAAAAPAPVETAEDPASHPGAVTSPMVGTVYTQAEPGAPAFVSVGDSVAEGDTLLIIEAMKTMNHIPATRAGTVKRILVEDGAAVEYGAPLMIIE
ncbi:acetyl-CoA carboxylase biotin carboxyl carrier protein [Roseovarius gahaiensis]|uniref:Biotin carboxyl carrier protein of acetyl-CoA carboxylase n=1 Tax=Roseovarius gahaiensis TaxID=2716691 RepID=A0A967EG60_9RHOB|nr:acetyl-CoA carboxylase biotin carboxyl carrier protein [Roseovarius gahaiensis]NHQ74225.1 acetyl-CoA carboxylase biotin carboxyl carrier protein [Roseovarius gahaiensis]